ncbi:APH(3') family aminoglycoside O-phosphotransferase [Sphingomonas endophytica]|uniref:APH(3') family aminoglycoside O-phosphotransferase n=1 Tax=Sphingomonas endophytica TaxID=869719 RepID=UPI000736957A|nr:APH(3') family aminoglycoside O-phosphotransferase [Sphingomonas endophytica]
MRLPDAIAARVGDRRPEAVADGQSGAAVYRMRGDGGDLFLKVGEGDAAVLVAAEAARLAWLADRAPASRIVATVETDGACWLLSTALPGLSAGAFIKADRRRAVAVAETLAGFLRRLHALPVAECPFDSSVAAWLPVVRDLVARGRVDTGDFDDDHAGWSAARVLATVEELAHHAEGQVVVHGDFSLGNVMLDEAGVVLGCVDVGRLGVGDPWRDIVIGWRDLGGFGEAAQRAFLAELGIASLGGPRLDLHRALDELF